jgi:predicted small integral membrane protein
MDFAWMQWTPITLALFCAVILMLTFMTIWDLRSPGISRKGFLPVAFARGERLFLSIVVFLATCVLWLAFLPDTPLEYALPVAAVLIIILVRWG